MVPLMADPFLTTESVTTIVRSAGIVAGGGGLLPGAVDQTPPQTLALLFAKPLKALSPEVTTPLISLFFHHCEPQKFTTSPTACGSTSPMTKAGPAGLGAVNSPLTQMPASVPTAPVLIGAPTGGVYPPGPAAPSISKR